MNSTKIHQSPVLFVVLIALVINGCAVGARVTVSATQVQYPISFTDRFYDTDQQLRDSTDYEPLQDFDFTFTKWGVSSIIEITNSQDVSERLNSVIEQYDGDAIVQLSISVNNPAIKNGLMWVSKSFSIAATSLFTWIAISEKSPKYSALAAGSGMVALFTPAAVEVKVEGTVVKLKELK